MTQSRQLAAIMFTDIVGYTALMEQNEQSAFQLLDENRKLQRPLIEKYTGKWLKEMGDGIILIYIKPNRLKLVTFEGQKW